MEKQVRSFKINYELNWEHVSIEELEGDIKAMKELGVTEVEIEASVFFECAEINIQPIQNRIETDEEYEQRVGELKLLEEANKRRELELLERLKNKYEK